MNDEFRALTTLLAKGLNFEDNAVLFAVGLKDGEQFNVNYGFKGKSVTCINLLNYMIEEFLDDFDDQDAATVIGILTDTIDAYLEKRFGGSEDV